MNEELIMSIYNDLCVEITATEEDDLNEAVLLIKVKNAYREVMKARQYPSSWNDEKIGSDMAKYRSNIHDLALYDYNMIGAEGESHHEQNGTARTYRTRTQCLNGVFPFVKLFYN